MQTSLTWSREQRQSSFMIGRVELTKGEKVGHEEALPRAGVPFPKVVAHMLKGHGIAQFDVRI